MYRVLLTSCVLLALAAPVPAAVTLQGPQTILVFDAADGFAVSELTHRPSVFNFIAPRPAGKVQDRSPWLLTVRTAAGQSVSLTTADARQAEPQAGPDKLTVTWSGVGAAAGSANLTVTMTVAFDASGKARWNLAVAGTATGVLWQVDFPRLCGLRPVGEDEFVTPLYLGRLTHNPTTQSLRASTGYPSPLSMQFMATYGTPEALDGDLAGQVETGWRRDRTAATGLYWAAEDGQSFYKRFGTDTAEAPGQMKVWVENVPPLARWPLPSGGGPQPVAYRMPYDVVLTTFTGDAYTAAGLYREFARRQEWCARGTADQWPAGIPAPGSRELTRYTPQWFREVGFWAKFYHEPAKIVPEWAAYEKWLRVPIASHYYRGPIAVFDDNYPEMLPTDPYYLSGVRDAKDMGVFPLPYTNGVIWDRDTQSYLNHGGEGAAIKDESGNLLTWDINREFYSYMCPGAARWRDEIGETAYKQIAEHGLSGVYLDCLTATASYPCYDATHGHSLRGGSYYAQGQRQMMQEMRARTRSVNPTACFFPEECGEWVVDLMDGFLTLDISRGYPYPGQQVFPLFPLVYHDYTINFGDDVTLGYPPNRFAWEFGTMLVWGAQPLFSPQVADTPTPGDPNSEMLREVVQAYHVAGRRFLQGGEAVPMTVRPAAADARPSAAPVDLAAAPYQFEYQVRPKVARTWQGPAVLGSAWRRQGDIGVVMVNITSQEQQVTLTLDPAKLGLKAPAQLLQTWPREPRVLGPAPGAHALTLPARTVAIVVLTGDVARAAVGNRLLDTPWELLTVDSGEFQPLTGPPGSLWACSDGPVLNDAAAGATTATPLWWDESGTLQPRQGLRVKAPEGVALPRKLADKPFLLLRPLPVQATWNCTLLSGDEHHLSAVGAARGGLAFKAPGLVVVTALDGRVLQPLVQTDQVKLDAAPAVACWVGYARLDTSDLPTALQTADRASQTDLKTLLSACTALTKSPSAAGLAAASGALWTLEQGLGELPAALAPGAPLLRLHEQIQALVVAQVAGGLEVTAEDDWLAPGLPKAVTVRGFTDDMIARGATAQIVPLGHWAAKAMQVAPAAGTTTLLTLNDPAYVERLVPVLAGQEVARGGQRYWLADLVHLDAERPMELQTQPLPLTAIGGRTAEATAVLRNWSTTDLQVTVRAQGPAGWQVTAPAEPVAVPALKNVTVKLELTPPATAARGRADIQVTAGYAPRGSVMAGVIAANVQPQLSPLVAAAAPWPRPPADQTARLRTSGKLALYGEPGQPLAVKINNLRVTIYTSSVSYRLLDPELKVLEAGQVAVDQSKAVQVAAATAGAYFLEVVPQQGSATVDTDLRAVAEMATKEDPLKLFCSSITRYFFVPQGSRGFRLGAQDGGPDEGAKLVATSPSGRVAFTHDGNYAGGEFEIAVRPEEAGKVWMLRVEPKQDLTLWLAGEVCPYLSTAPERVLAEAGSLGPN